MLSPDLQRIKHIRDYCVEVERTIARYGNSFDIFDHDPDYQRSVSFCILQIGELSGGCLRSTASQPPNMFSGDPSKECGIWLPTTTEA